ncbi:hypothetical protein Z949_285 [Sulfitobacter guttiformis KCTC 32187]|nr:hypothetical protein Z949_285 [Sulfitobacter guttiformis KCTC 32187]
MLIFSRSTKRPAFVMVLFYLALAFVCEAVGWGQDGAA